MGKAPEVVVYAYAGCSTCKKAKKWLDRKGVLFREIPIVEEPPSSAVLRELIERSGKPARKWFNTSGQSYRGLVNERGKDAVQSLSDREIVSLLARDGKLIKRPVVVSPSAVLVGFDEGAYKVAFA